MRDLGDKIGSTILAQSADVSCIPWSGEGVTVNYKEEGIPESKYLACCVRNVEEAEAIVKKIGYGLFLLGVFCSVSEILWIVVYLSW